MGAATLVEKLPGTLTRAQVKAAFTELKRKDTAAYGARKYTGSWKEIDAMSFSEDEYPNVTAAVDDLGDDGSKGYATAVRTTDDRVGQPWTAPAVVEKRASADAAAKAVRAQTESVLARIAAAPETTVPCAACGSSIAKSHLKIPRTFGAADDASVSLKCAVCGALDFPYTGKETANKLKLTQAYRQAAAETESALAAERSKSSVIVWVIVGCASV